ncbi:polymeric immunoglobulin receptor-like protein [Labeo rohita]|nr:polymeric immunoglobulin receptor-like protein [Labeo rohita]
MKIIWTFTLLMIPGVVSSISVTGYSGGGVIITCKYYEGHTGYIKYFCRGWSKCTYLIKTKENNKWVDDGRFSLYYGTRAAVFTVTIRDLSEQDSGTYYCGVERSGQDLYTKVNLNVITADCCEKSISLSAAAGGSVNISCKYPQSRRADVKFVCRRSGSDLCAEETSVKENRRWSAEGQIQLYDDREQQLLTGTISHVTQQHSAEYWCGVQSDQGHKSFITRVLINVTNSSLIISLVLVLLVLIIVCLLLLFLYKKHQSQDGDSSSQAGAEKHEVASNTGCVYEEIKDTHRRLPTNPSDVSDCVYAAVHKPPGDSQVVITSADDLNYAVVNFQKKADCPDRASNTDCVYEEIKDTHRQLPTNPSDVSNCVYAAVHKPPGDSQVVITSADDLNYAVVNFQKKADCPDSVSLRNNQDYSEYAAVSHHTA